MLNYDYLKDPSYKLKEDDTFSIKKIGKFKYMGIINKTKSNHLVIKIYKYI
jgi:RNA-binding protein YlmH